MAVTYFYSGDRKRLKEELRWMEADWRWLMALALEKYLNRPEYSVQYQEPPFGSRL